MTTEAPRRELALTVPGETDYLHLIRDFVTAVARKIGFSDERVGEIEIAVDEACANIIEHAYCGPARSERVFVATPGALAIPPIALRVSAFPNRIEVTIQDQGPRFALNQLGDLDLGEFIAGDRKRGIGMYIIRNFMDEVRHTYHPGQGNELTLVKYLASA